jgi:anaphase-promoting complex subunit 5
MISNINPLKARLGVHSSSLAYCDTLLDCYAGLMPLEEVLRARCRKAFHVGLKFFTSTVPPNQNSQLGMTGNYDDAITLLHDPDHKFSRTLRLQQQSMICVGLIKLIRLLHQCVIPPNPASALTHHARSDLPAAEAAISQLRASQVADPDVTFELDLLHLQYLLQSGDLSTALTRVDEMADHMELQGVDVYHSTQLAIFKAKIFAHAGLPEKGFSAAIRAANLAQKVGLMPALWDAVGCICVILLAMEEFAAVQALLDAVIPQVRGHDC